MRPALKSVPAGRTPEREELADAIKALAEARAAATSTGSIVERARGALVKAQMRFSTAESLLAEARERAIGAVTAEDGAQPADMKNLRRDVADARDDVDIAAEALKRAEATASGPGNSESLALWRVEAAADAVLALEAETAADALRATRDQLRRLEAITVRLVNFMHRDHPALPRLGSLRDAIRFPGDNESEAIRNAALAPWNAARQALLMDADAAVPEVR